MLSAAELTWFAIASLLLALTLALTALLLAVPLAFDAIRRIGQADSLACYMMGTMLAALAVRVALTDRK